MSKETSEIGKLTERVSSDPKSKLFVPLAEEYKKKGDLEMAIHVLSTGLKNNPDYVAARSFLGKLLIEQGELAGAQKEFETVIKVMPDNFLAQRKLGDLLILQNNSEEALKHYKIALALNPGDEEIASLVSDVESGYDVSARIHLTKATPLGEPTIDQAVSQQLPAAEGIPDLLSIPVESTAIDDEPGILFEPRPENQSAHLLPEELSSAVSPPDQDARESEEAEEVLFVEPLEPESDLHETASLGIDFVQPQQERQEAPIAVPEDGSDSIFGENREVTAQHEETAAPEELDLPDKNEDLEATSPFSLEHAFPGVISEADIVQGETPEETLETFQESSDKSDDFTTDTLAELYISQGFHEKAIDIYERMLADKPNSQGLKDKLERVRAAAGTVIAPQEDNASAIQPPVQVENEHISTAQPGGIADDFLTFDNQKEYRSEQASDAGVVPLNADTEAREYVPPAETEDIPLDVETITEPHAISPREQASEINFFAEPREYQPPPEQESEPTAAEEDAFGVIQTLTAQDFPVSPPQQQGEYEPREYVPPKAEPEPEQLETEQGRPEQKLPRPENKETIDRLESWLANIKKEQK
jgi:tetratricopeptide (TPR) repeat protein